MRTQVCALFAGETVKTLFEHLGVVRCLYLDKFKLISGGDQKKIVAWNYRVMKIFQFTCVHVPTCTGSTIMSSMPGGVCFVDW